MTEKSFTTNEPFFRITGRVILIALMLFITDRFSFTELGFQETNYQNAGIFLLTSILTAAVLSLLVISARKGGWRLIISLMLFFYTVKTLMVAIEAYYMSDVLPVSMAFKLLVDGAIQAAIVVPAAVALHGKISFETSCNEIIQFETRPWWSWLWRIPATGFIYVMLYIAAGIIIFRPLAYYLDPIQAELYLGSFVVNDPLQILGFQFLRGSLWAVLTIPVMAVIQRSRKWMSIAVALNYSVIMGLPNLVPNDVLSAGLRMAHTVEVFTANFVYGWAVVWLLARSLKKDHSET